jgi:hypothetical protein
MTAVVGDNQLTVESIFSFLKKIYLPKFILEFSSNDSNQFQQQQ